MFFGLCVLAKAFVKKTKIEHYYYQLTKRRGVARIISKGQSGVSDEYQEYI